MSRRPPGECLTLGSRLYSVWPYRWWRCSCSAHLARKKSGLGHMRSGPMHSISEAYRALQPASSRDSIRLVNTVTSAAASVQHRSEEHTSELQSRGQLVCRLLLEKKKQKEAGTEQIHYAP